MPRTVSRSLAAIVEDLEVDQPELVTMPTLRDLLERHGVATPANVVAARLRILGWLLDTGTRGVWEFSPASRAGPISRGDPTLPLSAALAAQPALPAALALSRTSRRTRHASARSRELNARGCSGCSPSCPAPRLRESTCW